MVFDALAKDIKPTEHTPSGVELILGISTNGTSYVFLSEYQTCLVMAHSGGQLLLGGRFKSPSDFESLSPIQFPSVNDLVLKIRKYKPKNKKGERFDNSAANKPYSRATVRSWRSEFELNRCASLHIGISLPLIRRATIRVLSRIIRHNLSAEKFFLPPLDRISWLGKATAVSIVVNVWKLDKRPTEERARDPKLIDIAWVEVPLNSIFGDHAGQDYRSSHIVPRENGALSQPGGRKCPSKYMSTTSKESKVMLAELKDFWERIVSSHTFLLVHDQDTVKAILNKAGVDLRTLNEGLHGCLAPSAIQDVLTIPVYHGHGRYGARTQDRDSHSRQRSRSPSPRRGHAASGSHSVVKRRPSSPSPSKSVFVIDIREQFKKVLGTDKLPRDDLPYLAESLGVSVKPGSICAGDDCFAIIGSWKAMASGSSVDEQHCERGFDTIKKETDVKEESGGRQPGTQNESDSEADPNDDLPNNKSARKDEEENVPHIGKLRYDLPEDDDDNYHDW